MKCLLPLLLISIGRLSAVDDFSQSLFVLERSTNANVIHYDAQITNDGTIDPKEPVIAYWAMLAEKEGKREELNALEKSLAYGFTIRKDDTGDSYWMTLVAQKHRPIHIFQKDGKVYAVTRIGGHDAYLHKIFVKTHRSGLLQMADYFELFGQELMTGEDCYERVVPEK
jgi:hypothetical protein